MRQRIAIVATHPIQYYAPWFARLASNPKLEVRVFYLWDFGIAAHTDKGFGVRVTWDLPLLGGYAHEFVPNHSGSPGTERFLGLWNPGLPGRLRAWHPDAVLLTAYNYASILWLLARWGGKRVPLVFRGDSHRLVPARGLTASARRSLIAAVFRQFNAVLYVGTANREYFRLHGVAEDRLFHAPHAVDNDRFFAAQTEARESARVWRRELGIAEGHRVVLFAGKFEEKKRPLDLLAAFSNARLDQVALLFVGSGEQEAALRAAASGRPDVFFAPFRNQTQMPAAYAACDLFVLPSYGPAETWGLAVNEAMCMGKPAVVSDHVGCARDLVLDGQTGLVFPAGDIAALREALRTAMADPRRLGDWGERARQHVRAYSYENATAGLLAALQHVKTAA